MKMMCNNTFLRMGYTLPVWNVTNLYLSDITSKIRTISMSVKCQTPNYYLQIRFRQVFDLLLQQISYNLSLFIVFKQVTKFLQAGM